MSYTIRIFDSEKMIDIDLNDKKAFTIGNDESDDYIIQDTTLKTRHIVFQCKSNVWHIKCAGRTFIGNKEITEKKIEFGDAYVLKNMHRVVFVVYNSQNSSIRKISTKDFSTITIGRNAENTIQLLNSRVSGLHATISNKDGKLCVEDLNSTNGTYVNGRRIKKAILDNNDSISIGIYDLIYVDGNLIIRNASNDININLSTSTEIEKNEYPIFKRSPRLKAEVPTGEIEIQSPPTIGTKPEINWLTVLVPPLSMISIMIAVVFLTHGSTMTLYYTAPMSLISILVSILSYVTQKKKHGKKEDLRLEKYKEHINNVLVQIEKNTRDQIKALNLAQPSLSECIDMVRNVDRRLWERKPQDEDFMATRIGCGTTPFSMEIKIPKNTLSIEEDNLKTKPEEIYEKFHNVKNTPAVCPLIKYPTCGIVGKREDALLLCKNMITQISALHCYTDVKIVTAFDESEMKHFEWLKWLPHSFDEERNKRYITTSKYSASEMFKEIEELLKQREIELQSEDSFRDKKIKSPFYLFVIANSDFIENESITKYILSNNSNLGVGCIMLFDDISMLPRDCSTIIEVKNQKGIIYNKENISDKKKFVFDNSVMVDFEEFSRNMAPIRVPTVSENALLPSTVTFFDGYNAKVPEEIDLKNNWEKNLTYKSMAVPIGVKANGEPFYFDIHEKKHGPHGLVAGMTGSGKSEMVQSWILSMAMKFSPEDVSFVLIDFKGTGLILPFMNMPHLAGTISDLDTNIKRNLIALENELSRRKALLDSVGVNNISSYLKLYKEGKATEPLSFLFIVIDEFAEFKVQFPDFMTVVNRIFAIGRTLGVFALLLTQKPSGVVDDKMNANTRFRWCLKVASSADSKEMIKHPDAAKITNPGRAYVQVGEDEVFELIQSYWSGAPYNPNKKSNTQKAKISIVELNGKKTSFEPVEQIISSKENKNEIDVLVNYLNDYVTKNNIPKAKNIWMSKLPTHISVQSMINNGFNGECWIGHDDKLAPIVGMIDDPAKQTQYPVKLNFTEEGHIAIYGSPSSGKTTLLQTAIMSLCLSYKPDEVNIYIMDFGGWSMGIFSGFPHVGGVANDNEEEKIEKTARLIAKELEARKRKFAQIGVSNIEAYRNETGEKVPYIILVLDNFGVVYNLYPELEQFFINLTREAGNYGIYLLTTCNTSMALGYKAGQNIKMNLALQMTEKSDYSSIVGKTDGLEPEKNAGRGLVKGNPPLEFQTALPADFVDESERVKYIKNMAEVMSNKWDGECAKPIPIMPDIIKFGEVKTSNIAIGLSLQDIEPVDISFVQTHYIIVSGKSESGKSNMLKTILKQSKGMDIAVVDFSGTEYSTEKEFIHNYITVAEDFDSYLESLVPELQARAEIHKKDVSATFSPILIVIDDLKSCFDSITNKSAERLNAIVNLGKGLNVNLLVAGNNDDIARMNNQGELFTAGLVKSPINILLGGCFRDHSAFKSNLHYSEIDTQLGDFEGYLNIKEKAVKFKAMSSKE